MSSALLAALEVLLVSAQILPDRLGLNSKNSGKPPSAGPSDNKGKDSEENLKKDKKKPGGQPGRIGTTLQKTDDPDGIKILDVERDALPPGESHPRWP